MPLLLTPKGRRYLKKLFSSKRPRVPAGRQVTVQRSTTTYLEQQGWALSGGVYPPVWHGYYRTRHGLSYKGKIEHSTPPKFYIHKPPNGLKTRHSHRACFHSLSDGWYSVHFSIMPKDLDSGVIKLERILYEAYLLTPKPA